MPLVSSAHRPDTDIENHVSLLGPLTLRPARVSTQSGLRGRERASVPLESQPTFQEQGSSEVLSGAHSSAGTPREGLS